MTFAQWLFQKYLDWQKEIGSRQTIEEFARHLKTSQPTVSEWMSGKYKPKSAKQINRLTELYGLEVYDVLNLPRPVSIPYDQFPPELKSTITEALAEASAIVTARGLSPDSPETLEIARVILSDHLSKLGKTE
jgi:transcriptional regulator with XRE-family HTH domain